MPNFQATVRETFAREGKFNIVHHRLVNHTESIAFFGGSEVRVGVLASMVVEAFAVSGLHIAWMRCTCGIPLVSTS